MSWPKGVPRKTNSTNSEGRGEMSADRTRNRPERPNPGRRQRLSFRGITVPEGHVARVFNDMDDRIQEALERGYKFVKSDGTLGDERVADPACQGAYVTKSVGGGVKGYLMAIPKEWYDEDQAAKQAEVDRLDAALNRKPGEPLAHGGELPSYGQGHTRDR